MSIGGIRSYDQGEPEPGKGMERLIQGRSLSTLVEAYDELMAYTPTRLSDVPKEDVEFEDPKAYFHSYDVGLLMRINDEMDVLTRIAAQRPRDNERIALMDRLKGAAQDNVQTMIDNLVAADGNRHRTQVSSRFGRPIVQALRRTSPVVYETALDQLAKHIYVEDETSAYWGMTMSDLADHLREELAVFDLDGIGYYETLEVLLDRGRLLAEESKASLVITPDL